MLIVFIFLIEETLREKGQGDYTVSIILTLSNGTIRIKGIALLVL